MGDPIARGVRVALVLLTALTVGVPFSCSPVLEPTFQLGDVNHDGEVSMLDALDVQRYVLDPSYPIDTTLADVSGDGTVSAYDAALIMWVVER